MDRGQISPTSLLGVSLLISGVVSGTVFTSVVPQSDTVAFSERVFATFSTTASITQSYTVSENNRQHDDIDTTNHKVHSFYTHLQNSSEQTFETVYRSSGGQTSSISSDENDTRNVLAVLQANEDFEELMAQYSKNRALDSGSLWTLAAVYTVLILIGTLGNGLVCVAVARQPKMRTSRNLFIINLAISDLLLCFFTIPFSLVEISVKFWPFGTTMCKLVVALQATSIFVSTLSITAIALDRYQVILHSMDPERAGRGIGRSARRPTRRNVPHLVKLFAIWACAILLATPLYIFRTVHSFKIGMPQLDRINFCVENWPIPHGRLYYSIFSMLIQYLVPITIVSVVYTRLGLRLKTRALRRTSTTALPKLRTRLQARARRTNLLLVAIALVFCASWLPLNLLNIIADVADSESDKNFRIIFAICHMAGMSSSCTNPFLYGWLNQNFRNEFEDIFYSLKSCFFRVCLRKETMPPVSGHFRHAASRRASRVSLTMSPNLELTNCSRCPRQARYDDHENGASSFHVGSTITIALEDCPSLCNGVNQTSSHYARHHQQLGETITEVTNVGFVPKSDSITAEFGDSVQPHETSSKLKPLTSAISPKLSPKTVAVDEQKNIHSQSNDSANFECSENNINNPPKTSSFLCVGNGNGKFKRLLLTDSRKRKRMRPDSQKSISTLTGRCSDSGFQEMPPT